MDTRELWMTAARTAGLYLMLLVVIRLLGKRTVGNFSAFDLLVALMIGEIVDEVAYGDVIFLQGATVITVVALLHYGNSWLTYANPFGIEKILEGEPAVIVRNGELARPGMRKERMNESDVLAELRACGVEDLREVRLAFVENDGQVSIIKHDWARTIQKADLGGEWADQKNADTNGEDEPPPEARTVRPKDAED